MPDGRAHIGALFSPQSVALIGASPSSAYCRRVLSNLRALGFADERIFLINPNYSEIDGRRCYANLGEVSAPVDVAMVLTPKDAVPMILKEAAASGARGAVVLASGFAETGPEGAGLQKQISSVGDRLAVCGPNTMGLASFSDRLALFSGELPPKVFAGPLSAVFQSGGMLNVFLQLCAYRRIGIGRLVATGNEAVLSLADYLNFYAADPQTKMIALHVESIRDGEEFRRALARCRNNRKPVVALLVGRSARARATVQAHSGNLVASARWEAALKHYGVMCVRNLDEMVNVCSLLAYANLDDLSPGVQLATVSGGDCSWLSDLADRAGLDLPDLPAEIKDKLKPILRKPRFVDNPLDVGGLPRAGDNRFERALDQVCQSPRFSLIAFRLNYPLPFTEAGARPYRVAAAAALRHGKKPVFLTRASEALDDHWMDFFAELKAPFLLEYERALGAIKRVQEHLGARAAAQAEPVEPANERARGWIGSKSNTLTFCEARELLGFYGIPVVETKPVGSADEAVAAARSLGFPVALKVDAKEIAHKTEAGGVALHLATEEKVREAYHAIALGCAAPGGPGTFSLIVQPMVENVAELLVGSVNDPEVGPLVVVAVGGIFTEALKDSATGLAPVSLAEARRMIFALRGKELLLGARGRPQADIDELARVIRAVSLLARDCSDRIQELDLNPVMVLPKGEGVRVVDALVVLKK
ncbi:MAG TPA: acetate--CoA ligase family protein [Candidatus Acidoferrales bacterium]|nr:acetate--CoA ligase family protein [Candidatus Acidoferrales bacterium]